VTKSIGKPKKNPRLEPRWKDGRLDPDWIGEAGLRFVRPWLQRRLEGHDPLQPIDRRVDEDPEAFVVDLLREVGARHPAAEAIGRAARDLLDEARAEAPHAPAYVRTLLRLTELVSLPLTRPWFDEEIGFLADGAARRWKEGATGVTAYDVAFAAVKQKAGSKAHWERLLARPDVATIALMALAPSFDAKLAYLGRWWGAVDDAEREREVEYLLRAALRDHGERLVRERILAHRAALPAPVRAAMDRHLAALGVARIEAPRSGARLRAIRNAGWRANELLADAS